MGAWMTIESCELNFVNSGLTREYIVVSNGNKETADTHNHMRSFKEAGLIAHYSHRDEPMSPPNARQYGSQFATGKYLAFFDNHCLLLPDFFKRANLDFDKYGMDALHGSCHYDLHRGPVYHYRLVLQKGFWGEESPIAERGGLLSYPIAMAGHGAFIVTSDCFKEVGGYWDGFEGYAGEEPYFDLKLALLDKKNYLDPRMGHIHYIGERGYSRHFSQDYARNMMMAANIIGGEKWMYKTFNYLVKSTKNGFNESRMYEVMMEADKRSESHAAWLRSVRKRTLEEQLLLFETLQIAH